MKTNRQKQQNKFSLIFHSKAFRRKIASTNAKPRGDTKDLHLKTQLGLKPLLPAIAIHNSSDPADHPRRRRQTENSKMQLSSLQILKNSIYQYKTAITTEQESLTENRLRNMNQRKKEQSLVQNCNNYLLQAEEKKSDVQSIAQSRNRKIKASNITQQQIKQQTQCIGSINAWKQKFKVSVESMNKKNEKSLSQTLKYLSLFNPFFHRNNQTTSLCLLKIGKIIQLKRSLLYKTGEESSSFYIILLGKVKIQNGSLTKQCQTGQTLNQQIIFSTAQKKISFEKANTKGRTYLLEVSMEEWMKLTKKMLSHGFKRQINQAEALIKRNYIIKNWLRNKARKQAQI